MKIDFHMPNTFINIPPKSVPNRLAQKLKLPINSAILFNVIFISINRGPVIISVILLPPSNKTTNKIPILTSFRLNAYDNFGIW